MRDRKTKRYRGWCFLILAAALVCLAGNPVVAQEKAAKKTAEANAASDKAGKSRSGADPNVKSKSNQNDPKKAAEAQIQKQGGKTRGYGPYLCVVHVDNRTGWAINVLIDGNFRGAVGGGGDLYIATGNGPTLLYAEAEFTDGSYIPWGPRSITCSGSYTWRLWP